MKPEEEKLPLPGHTAAPVSMDVSVTGRCNLSCRYCFYADEMTGLRDLSTDQWRKAFGKLGEARVLRVTLTGGEPFVREDIFSLIDSVIGNRMRYSILTNGTLLDSNVVESLGKGSRRIRMDSIQVSLDGSTAQVHDASRPGSFRQALAGLRLLKAGGFPTIARVTLNRHNMDDLDGIAELLLDDLGLDSFSTCDASPIGMGCTYGEELTLDHEGILSVGLQLEELLSRYPGRITAQAGPLATLRMYRKMEEALRDGSASVPWRKGCLSSCGGVFERMAVLHDGSVVPCSMLHDMKMGNILRDDLLRLWNSSPAMGEVRRRYVVRLAEIPECRACRWSEVCNGGCPGIVRQMTGKLLAPDRRNCYRDFLAATGLDRVPDPLHK